MSKRLAIVVVQQYRIIEPARTMRLPVIVWGNGWARAMRGAIAENLDRIRAMANGFADDVFVDIVDWATDRTMAGCVLDEMMEGWR